MAENEQGDWEERQGATLWKPDKEGDELIGKLKALRQSTYGTVYDVELADGTIQTVPRSAFLENRIAPDDVGKDIKLVYTGDQVMEKGKNPMRTYQIFFKKTA